MMDSDGVGRRGIKPDEDKAEWSDMGSAEGGRWMKSWVDGGILASSLSGRGRGRTRWSVRGGEGSVVAKNNVKIARRDVGREEHTILKQSIDHLSLDVSTIPFQTRNKLLILFRSIHRAENDLGGGGPIAIGVSVGVRHDDEVICASQ